jgi:hypothetical protein
MEKKYVVLFVVVLCVAMASLVFVGNMTGNAITGAAVGTPEVDNEYFRIDDFGSEVNEEVINDTQNSSGSE